MTPPIEFPPDEAGQLRLQASLTEFSAVVRGVEPDAHAASHQPEQRERLLAQCLRHVAKPIWTIRIARETDSYPDAKDRFAVHRPGDGMAFPLWHELAGWLQSIGASQHLLLDLTTLSGSSIFQMHAAAVRAGNIRVSCVYTAPTRYPQVDKPNAIAPVITRSIKQPYGYRSFAQEHLRQGARKHVIILGFDRHRPNKFIEHYQWPLTSVFALLGDPAYVDRGVEQARLSLGPVFQELEKLGHVRRINPKLIRSHGSEAGIADVLQELGQDVSGIDIVPLGPKPTLLGSIMYWQSLPDAQQERTRLLYDFPVSRQVRTTGAETTWLYRDVVAASL